MAQIVDGIINIPYFGKLSFGNAVDWLVTVWMACILCVATTVLGGVRLDTHLILLPMFAVLLFLHGLWLAVDKEEPKRLSQVPIWFVPFLIWIALSCLFFSSTPWLGWIELVYALELFVFFWVLVNNVRTRAHIGFLLTAGLIPVAYALLIGFYQAFQTPDKVVDAMAQFSVMLSPDVLGSSVGTFADPETFSVLLLVVLPAFIFSTLVLRLPFILRILCGYAVLMTIGGLIFAGLFWPIIPILLFLPLCAILCFKKSRPRILFLFGTLLSLGLFFGVAYLFSPNFVPALENSLTVEGDGVRGILWKGAYSAFLSEPIFGTGAGSFAKVFEEQDTLVTLSNSPLTPLNDYLLLLSQFGIIGAILILFPLFYVFVRGYKVWKKEPYRVRLKLQKGEIVSPNKFLLSLGLGGTCAIGICAGFTFIGHVIGVAIYGALFLGIFGKAAFNRRIVLPSHLLARLSYLALAVIVGVLLNLFFLKKVESQALELHARQILDQIIEERIHLGSNPAPLDQVVLLLEDAVELDPKNVDAWIGLSAAITQQFYRNPGSFREVGARATNYAETAVALTDDYWRCWAQLGIAKAMSGDFEVAGAALDRALELAPNTSNALYFKAAFLSAFSDQRVEAMTAVERALEVDPGNSAARRLQQKLLIL